MKTFIYISLLTFVISCSLKPNISSQKLSKIEGKVTFALTGEAILFGTVAVYKENKLILSAETDVDGNYALEIEVGNYDVEASYIGCTAQMQTNVDVKEGKTSVVNFALSEGVLMDAVEIVEYKVPLIEINNTTSGSTVTSEAIRSLPVKNINAISAKATGVSPNKVNKRQSQNLSYDIYEKDFDNESYSKIKENKPKSPLYEPLSTFAIDVDRASYSNIRRYLNANQLPPKDAIRIEEMVNYFNYDYPEPKAKNRPIAVHTQLTQCPWNSENRILHIGLQGKKIDTDDLPSSNLVFLIDVSGSMGSPNKLPLIKESLKLLVNNLRDQDNVAIVTYAGRAGVALESTGATNKTTINEAIDKLGAGGSTAGAQGIKTAYQIARKNFKQDGNNRVILATDGDFNVGISSNDQLLKLIEKERESGIFLSVLGYGMGNYKDDKMQILADAGNGNHAYIDDIKEAKKTLVSEFGGTLFTIAKDVKIQVEFNPAYVGSYRLVGYENRLMNAEDFRNDAKDAGEVGAGHSVTALYEISPAGNQFVEVEDKLLYQKRNKTLKKNKELATVRIRYKTPMGYKGWEFDHKVKNASTLNEDLEDHTKHAIAIAEFGMLLRKSNYKENASYSSVEAQLQEIKTDQFMKDEVLELVKKAKSLDKVK